MYYMLNPFIFIRKINDFLVILDKRTDEKQIGDASAYVFLKYLTYEPQSTEQIIPKIQSEFIPSPSFFQIEKDFSTFMTILISKEYISSGSTIKECLHNKKIFEYNEIDMNKYIPTESCNEQIIEGYQSLPVLQTLMLEIDNACNERCLHCYIPHQIKNSFIKDEDFYSIIDQAKQASTILEIEITGGECMLHPSFKNYIKYIKDNGFALTVLSNLTLLDDETIEILKSGTLSHVQTTVFSLDEKIHDSITTIKGSLNNTLNNIKKLKAAGIPVHIATQVMELNKDSIPDIIKFALESRYKLCLDWTISAREDLTTDNLNLRVNNFDEYKKLFKQRLILDNRYKCEMTHLHKCSQRCPNDMVCGAGLIKLQVGTNLETHACAGWDISCGSLKENTLLDIWNNSETLKKIRNIKLKDFKKCANCNSRNMCLICPAQAYSEGSAFEMPDYVCNLFKTIDTTFTASLENEA